MSAPRRENSWTVIRDLIDRVDRLERANNSRDRQYMQNVDAAPATPDIGGVFYVEGNALKYKSTAGTTTTIGPA